MNVLDRVDVQCCWRVLEANSAEQFFARIKKVKVNLFDFANDVG